MTKKTNSRDMYVGGIIVLLLAAALMVSLVFNHLNTETAPETEAAAESVTEAIVSEEVADTLETLSESHLKHALHLAPVEIDTTVEEVEEEVEEEAESLEETETETEAPVIPSTTPAVAVTEPVQAAPVMVQETTAAPAPAHVHVEETKHEHQWSPEYALVTKSENVKVIDVEAHTEEKQIPLGTCSYSCDTCGFKLDDHDEMINHLLDAHSGGSCTYVPNYETKLVQVEEQFHYETVTSEVEEHTSDICLSCGERRMK